jgi:3-phenylpropionate/trans-cinnamate dioxygenase ferredoxin reductase subunit
MAGLVIVGGGAAGHSCIAAHRDHGGSGSITLVSADDRLPYFRPHLTKDLLTGDVSLDDIGLDPREWYVAHDVEVLLSCRATGIDTGNRTLATEAGPIDFDSLVLATGSSASRLPIPGGDDPRVCTIRSASDAARLLDGIESGEPVLVIGSGFVGCEVAGSLRTRGLDVTLASTESLPQEQRLGPDAGCLIDGWLRDLGVSMRPAVHVERLEHGSAASRAHLDDGTAIESGWVVMATGASPNIELAESAGLVAEGAVPVDASMRTPAPDVFAVGDIARAFNASAGRSLRVEHWGDAERMGAVAGAVTAGAEDAWAQVPGFWSSIAGRQLKYVAWGDGWDRAVVKSSAQGVTIWYGRDGQYVGLLTHEHDDDLETGTALIQSNAPFDLG